MSATLTVPQAETPAATLAGRPIRIVRMIARLNIGGPAVQTMLLTERLQGPTARTLLVVGAADRNEGDLRGAAAARGLRMEVIPSLRRAIHPWRDAQAWWRILRILRREEADLLHTHTAKAGALGRSAAWIENHRRRLMAVATGCPVQLCRTVHTFHGHVLEGYFGARSSRVFLGIERWLARRTGCLIAVSPAVRDELVRLGVASPARITVVPLGLHLERMLDLPPPSADAEPLTVGLVGRLVPVKNHELFLALAKAWGQSGLPAVRFEVIGDGERRAELEARARALGVQATVRFTGWAQDMAEVYRRLDIVCLTSWNEGTPVSLIEALAAGRPVMATDVGGVRDVLGAVQQPLGRVRKATHGLLVDPGDAEGCVEALRYLVSRPEERLAMGAAGRGDVRVRYGIDRLVHDLEIVYRALVHGAQDDQQRGGTCTH